jgi:hypothetical protein
MQGMPVTIRTIDVGADKPLDGKPLREDSHLNPALGLRAIRWSLADPSMFLTQLRAILRAAAHGEIHLLIPMLAHASEIRQTLSLLDFARAELDNRGVVHGAVKVGAMIEIPAAALTLRTFLKHFDFLSIGTNDLIQYTLAIDRADESVAHLYDPTHPAVLRLVADTIAECRRQGKPVSVCGEMAGDVGFTARICEGCMEKLRRPMARSNSVNSGSPAISPQTLTPLPAARAWAMDWPINCSTAGCHGSYRWATASSARSIANVYWIRSLVPIETKSTYRSSNGNMTAAAGISIMTPSSTRV